MENLLKTTNKKHHSGEVKFPHFASNENICPVYCLTKYLDAKTPRRDKYYFTVYNHIKTVQTNIKTLWPGLMDKNNNCSGWY